MTYQLRYTSWALADMEHIIGYYREVAPHMVSLFKPELRRLARSLAANPLGCQLYEGQIRRKYLSRFPFTVFYLVGKQDKVVTILTIRHQSMSPLTANDLMTLDDQP